MKIIDGSRLAGKSKANITIFLEFVFKLKYIFTFKNFVTVSLDSSWSIQFIHFYFQVFSLSIILFYYCYFCFIHAGSINELSYNCSGIIILYNIVSPYTQITIKLYSVHLNDKSHIHNFNFYNFPSILLYRLFSEH